MGLRRHFLETKGQTMKRASSLATMAAIASVGLVTTSCEQRLTTPEATMNASHAFNPQPEPPGRILSFSVQGRLTGGWRGRFTGADGDGGALFIVVVDTRPAGKTQHLWQTWHFTPPDPVAPFDAELSGIVNLKTGRLVLNGTSQGAPVHVRGEVSSLAGGVVNIGGELMFNPQPEPPAQR